MVKETINNYQFRITIGAALAVIIFLISMSVNLATWKTEIEARNGALELRQEQLVDTYLLVRDDISKLESRQAATDIRTAEINTRLNNIQSLLIDIREDLKNK